MHTLQTLLTSGNAGTQDVMTTLGEMLSIIENHTNSITTQVQGTQPLTSLADAINLVHERTQEQAQQHVQVITAMQAIVERLSTQPTMTTDGATPGHFTLGRVQIPHPLNPTFSGDSKVMSLHSFKAKLNNIFDQ
ncbi:hypothetical protein BG003_001762 [Podila horticola]|nr:hypothetical protein BG003_001762 [Podila horticola]